MRSHRIRSRVCPGPRPASAGRVRALLLALLLPLVACDQYAELKEGMTPGEVARFDRGKALATPCWTCHDLAGQIHKVGPHLHALEGRRAGSAAGYAYSEAFAGLSFAWTEPTLDAFLANPQVFAPGTRMVSPGIANRGQRADLIFFLLRATAPRQPRTGG